MNPETQAPIQVPKETWKSSLLEWARVIIIALIIAMPIRWFIAEPFIVDGASMDPTFATGQFLIVDRISYRFEDPARGDVIVFEYPNDPSRYYIKRIIALPGETISIKDGHVTIKNAANPEGFELTEPYIAEQHISHENTSVTLNNESYFVMGDNRAQSSDSRYWGPLKRSFFVGKPVVRLFPVGSLSVWPGDITQ